jgi:hypothetical protein
MRPRVEDAERQRPQSAEDAAHAEPVDAGLSGGLGSRHVDHSTFVPAALWILPFATLLLSIAILPLALPHFWESNPRKLAVSLLLGVPVLALYFANAPEAIAHAAGDYASFIILLGSLFVISGGVVMD